MKNGNPVKDCRDKLWNTENLIYKTELPIYSELTGLLQN
jgi:hypothetical protein